MPNFGLWLQILLSRAFWDRNLPLVKIFMKLYEPPCILLFRICLCGLVKIAKCLSRFWYLIFKSSCLSETPLICTFFLFGAASPDSSTCKSTCRFLIKGWVKLDRHAIYLRTIWLSSTCGSGNNFSHWTAYIPSDSRGSHNIGIRSALSAPVADHPQQTFELDQAEDLFGLICPLCSSHRTNQRHTRHIEVLAFTENSVSFF
jgi:hypothetical protein